MRKLLLTAIVIIVFNIFGNAQTSNTETDDKVFRSPFRYVIVSNEIDPAIGRDVKARRFIEVLMDGKSFSKENLITLFKLVSNRYRKPAILYINIFTNLEDVETPEERDQPHISEDNRQSDAPEESDLAVGIFSKERAFFYIYFAHGDFEEVKIR